MKAPAVYSIIMLVIVTLLLGVAGYFLYDYLLAPQEEPTIEGYNINLFTYNANTDLSNLNSTVTNSVVNWLRYDSQLSVAADEVMQLALSYPEGWGLEFRNSPAVLNFYNLSGNADDNLNNSFIFVQYYDASDFEQRNISAIQNQKDLLIAENSVKYFLATKLSTNDYSQDRPEWIFEVHDIYEIKTGDRIYVVDISPEVKDEIQEKLLNNFLPASTQ